MNSPQFIVAIVGRPNVGKSSLFNRLIGQRKSVTSSVRGTTRDRIIAATEWNGVSLTFIDTGGRELKHQPGLEASVQSQVLRAVRDADICMLVCDGHEGWLPADQKILEELRAFGKPIAAVINKMDDQVIVPPDFFASGLKSIFPVSAIHGRGTGDLLDFLTNRAREGKSGHEPAKTDWSLAIVGRQNVGKSSLLNRIIGDERAIVSDAPGTTRDVVDSLLKIGDKTIRVLDTAGLRHRRKVRNPVDTFSMMRTRQAIDRSDVVWLVLDATLGVANDDRRIINEVCEAGSGLLLIANKWDLLPKGDEAVMIKTLRRLLPTTAFAPIVAVSAKTGYRVHATMQETQRVIDTMRRGVSEEVCVGFLRRAWESHLPPRYRGRAIKLKTARWVPGKPARLILNTVPIGKLPTPYQHYLIKRLYANPRFLGQPVKLLIEGPQEKS